MEIKLLDMHASIVIDKEANKKMELIVDMCPTEVGWLGLVKREGPLKFRVLDIFLVKQEVNSATTELDPGAVNALDRELWANGIRTMENQRDIGLYMWGHSHVNMTTGPSGQDVTQFKELYDAGPPFYIRLITNKKKDVNIALFVNMEPFGRVIFSDVSWKVECENEDALRASLKVELDEKVKPLTYKGGYESGKKSGKDVRLPAGGVGNGYYPDIPGMWDHYDALYPSTHNYNREPLSGHAPASKRAAPKAPGRVGEVSRTRIIRTNGPSR